MFYIYILKSKTDKKFYTGFTGDLRRRLKDHISGNADSTKNRRPLDLIYYEAYKSKTSALKREKFLKTTKGKQQLKKQIFLKKRALSSAVERFVYIEDAGGSNPSVPTKSLNFL